MFTRILDYMLNVESVGLVGFFHLTLSLFSLIY